MSYMSVIVLFNYCYYVMLSLVPFTMDSSVFLCSKLFWIVFLFFLFEFEVLLKTVSLPPLDRGRLFHNPSSFEDRNNRFLDYQINKTTSQVQKFYRKGKLNQVVTILNLVHDLFLYKNIKNVAQTRTTTTYPM